MRIIHWFRRDLRLTDNPSLEWACQHADALCLVYVHAPDEESPWAAGAASCWWLHHALHALSESLAQRGHRLIIRHGSSLHELQQIADAFNADAVSWNRLYEPAIIARDRGIKTRLSEAGYTTRSHNAALLLEPWTIETGAGRPYRVFTPFWKAAKNTLPGEFNIAEPPDSWPLGADIEGLSIDALGLRPQHPWGDKLGAHWRPGEAGALDQLDHFVEHAAADYSSARDIPAVAGTSRLSPHLHFGEIGPRQIRAALFGPDAPAAEKYLAELGWREFAHHLLYHFADTPQREFNPKFEAFEWRSGEAAEADLKAWQRGQTGIELVDAGMRELWATGWMHNRVRMIVGSLLTKNLGIDWRAGAAWFWDTLVDADLANNTLGWQWIAGCGADAAPYFRIFNPDTQAERFDPDRRYRDRWLSQPLAEPIIDLKTSRQAALDRYARLKEDSA